MNEQAVLEMFFLASGQFNQLKLLVSTLMCSPTIWDGITGTNCRRGDSKTLFVSLDQSAYLIIASSAVKLLIMPTVT